MQRIMYCWLFFANVVIESTLEAYENDLKCQVAEHEIPNKLENGQKNAFPRK